MESRNLNKCVFVAHFLTAPCWRGHFFICVCMYWSNADRVSAEFPCDITELLYHQVARDVCSAEIMLKSSLGKKTRELLRVIEKKRSSSFAINNPINWWFPIIYARLGCYNPITHTVLTAREVGHTGGRRVGVVMWHSRSWPTLSPKPPPLLWMWNLFPPERRLSPAGHRWLHAVTHPRHIRGRNTSPTSRPPRWPVWKKSDARHSSVFPDVLRGGKRRGSSSCRQRQTRHAWQSLGISI